MIEASSVALLAVALPGAIAGKVPGTPIDERRARDLAALAAFYRRAADAGQVVIVAEV